jgi:anti-sigma B factor antagonist
MNFTISQDNIFALIVSNVEKLDANNSAELKSELVALNKAGVNSLVIDLTKTKYCDSSGLSAILIGNRLCKDTNGKFAICGLQPNVQKMITISQLDKVLTITTLVEEAKATFAIG